MSRLQRFVHSLAAGYVLLGANVFYTLASFRLANHFLSPTEFGLWGVVTSIAQYIALVDLGMTSTSRILVDYKDQPNAGHYGSVIQTFGLVSLVQAALVMALGIGLSFGLVKLLHIPPAQHQTFVYLMIGQCGVTAAGFLARILLFLLAAHQRYDVSNYIQAVTFGVMFGVMWLAFRLGQGVYSTLYAQFASCLVWTVVSSIWILKLGLLPRRGCWGRPTWARFRELFKLGSDLFLSALGFQLLTASQTLVLTRVVGLEASAVWNVCTRTFAVVTQLIYRVLDFSPTILAEMMVRGERARLYQRFRSLVILTASLSVLCGALFAVCNQPFVQVWLGGKYSWSPRNDVLLAVWLLFQAVARCHLGLVGVSKDIRSMRYIYACEGLFFVSLSLLVLRQGGISAMLLCAIAGSLLFSTPYGFWRTSRYFAVPWQVPAWKWWLPPLRLACGLLPIATLTWWLGQRLSLRLQFVFCGSITGSAGLWLLLRYGLDEHLRHDLLTRAPARLQPFLLWLSGPVKTGHAPGPRPE
jgi:O-antigen/teichoic acid export membrane protein